MPSFIAFLWAVTMFINAVLAASFIHWQMIVLFIVPVGFIILSRKLSNAEIKDNEISGFEMGKGFDLADPDHPKTVKNVVLEDKALNLGFLAVGGPGSGKTVAGIGMLEYFTKNRKEGWVYWEGKGDKDIYQQAMSCGAQPDYFFSSELESTDTVNVFAGPADSVIERLTQVLIVTESDYYRNAQRAALRATIPILKALKQETILRDLYVLLKKPQAAQYVLNMAKEQGVAPDIIELANDFFEMDADKRDQDINGLLTRLTLFVSDSTAERLNDYEPSLDLEKACQENAKVYLHLPYTNMAKDIAILLTEQVGVIAKNRQLYESMRTPWPQMFDDWGAFFYPNIGPITARCRSAKMPVSFLFQSKGQTDRAESGGYFTTEVTDNIGGFFALRINGEESASWAAKQFGMFDSKELTQTENSNFAGHGFSYRQTEKIRAADLKNLDAGEAIISCLISGPAGASENKHYRARFPLPDFSQADNYDWPVINREKTNNTENHLNLWADFMDRDRLKALQKESLKQLEESENDQESTLDNEVDFI